MFLSRERERERLTRVLWGFLRASPTHGNRCWQPRRQSSGSSHLVAAEAARIAHPTLPKQRQHQNQTNPVTIFVWQTKKKKQQKLMVGLSITWWKSKASRRFMSARNRSIPNPSIHTGRPVLAIHLLNTKKKIKQQKKLGFILLRLASWFRVLFSWWRAGIQRAHNNYLKPNQWAGPHSRNTVKEKLLCIVFLHAPKAFGPS